MLVTPQTWAEVPLIIAVVTTGHVNTFCALHQMIRRLGLSLFAKCQDFELGVLDGHRVAHVASGHLHQN